MKENFSFLDQFLDQEINLTDYLKRLSEKNNVNYTFTSKQPIITTIKNLFYQVDIINNYKSNILFFNKYQVKPGEKIENVAYKIYDDVSLWWVIAIFNDIKNPYIDWVFTDEQLNYLVDMLVKYENRFPRKTYFKFLEEQNEKRRILNILKSEYISELIYAFIKRIKGEM